MNIIVGLGNPGSRYELTRHNAGFLILDNLRQVMECPKFTSNKRIFSDVCKVDTSIFIKPQTFMNESGKAVRSALDFYKLLTKGSKEGGFHNLFVIHDDLDLELGSYKIQYGTGPKGHNGLLSVYQHLGTQNFWHVRVGVDSRQGERSIPPDVYVLEKFAPQELEKVNQVKFDLVKELLQRIK
ncbi:MAG: peptidyl-tRNA hydrolase [Patescibacteria group bacterium]|nr:MAG: peptidyl-tRNA hydrolase [Patescibacteria group bacterium]